MSQFPSNILPEVVADIASLRAAVARARAAGKTVGLVPTMGALHEGHISLVEQARRECGLVVVTIFVNPTQFAPTEDFNKYPRTLEADCRLLAKAGADLVFTPTREAMYPAGHATYVDVEGPALRWEGAFRPGHFRGVATIVLKLFNLVCADRAYFGRKDFQQAVVVRQMVKDLDLPIHIEVCPTVRAADGLALSSRNAYLSPDERGRALAISRGLREAKARVAAGARDAEPLMVEIKRTLEEGGIKIDYVAIVDRQTLEPVATVHQAVMLIAGRVGTTRLIDNELLP